MSTDKTVANIEPSSVAFKMVRCMGSCRTVTQAAQQHASVAHVQPVMQAQKWLANKGLNPKLDDGGGDVGKPRPAGLGLGARFLPHHKARSTECCSQDMVWCLAYSECRFRGATGEHCDLNYSTCFLLQGTITAMGLETQLRKRLARSQTDTVQHSQEAGTAGPPTQQGLCMARLAKSIHIAGLLQQTARSASDACHAL